MPAVIGLAAMGHAPIAEEIFLVRVGAGVEVFNGPDAGGGKTRRDVAGELSGERWSTR